MAKYKVTYLVTREEFYEIEADTTAIAADKAFSEGLFIDSGETISVSCEQVQKVRL